MDNDKDGAWWVSQTLEDLAAEIVAESDEAADAYLRERWLSAMMAVLRNARRSAGLSQQALAERLGTQQPAVSRLEQDEDTTLGRFVDYLIAAGRMPREVETAPIEETRRHIRSNADAPLTSTALRAWQATEDGLGSGTLVGGNGVRNGRRKGRREVEHLRSGQTGAGAQQADSRVSDANYSR